MSGKLRRCGNPIRTSVGMFAGRERGGREPNGIPCLDFELGPERRSESFTELAGNMKGSWLGDVLFVEDCCVLSRFLAVVAANAYPIVFIAEQFGEIIHLAFEKFLTPCRLCKLDSNLYSRFGVP